MANRAITLRTGATGNGLRFGLVALLLVASACGSSSNATSETAESASDRDVVTDFIDAVDNPDSDPPSAIPEESPEDVEPSVPTDFSPLCQESDPAPLGSRVDVQSTGNRVASGSINFAQVGEVEVELPGEGIWVTADPAVEGGWYVVLSRGSSVRVSPDGDVTSASTPVVLPPELDSAGDPLSPFRFHNLFEDPIEDGRVVIDGTIAAVLSTSTDVYDHGVLGDRFEAEAIEWVDTCSGERGRIAVAAPDVIEGISPMLADIDDDGQIEILVTLGNRSTGARLAAFELDGSSAGESDPIGQGNRWRNQLAVGAFGPAGETEIIDVETPHIGGTVQAFRQTVNNGAPRLELVAVSDDGYTSHIIRSRNLSMGLGVDADGDGFPDVVVPSKSRKAIVALTRTNETENGLAGWSFIGQIDLEERLTSNIASQEQTPGEALIALADGAILRIWK